jgi:hypothetical protein
LIQSIKGTWSVLKGPSPSSPAYAETASAGKAGICHYTYIYFIKITRAMTTKLTLTVAKDVIEKAKSYAKKTGRSLSGLIESYLEEVVQENNSREKVSPQLKKLIGVVKLPGDFDERRELKAYFRKKHL